MNMNAKTYDFRDLVRESGLTKRNVRYYLYELIPEAERIKGSQKYAKPVRDKIVFIGKLRDQTKKYRVRLSLEGIREILNEAADSIEAVADGREPLEIFDQSISSPEWSKDKINKILARGESVLNINMDHIQDDRPAGSAKTYIQEHRSSFYPTSQELKTKPKKGPRKRWQSVQLGQKVELRVRGAYSQKTLDQLALLGQFVDSILKEDENNGE